MGMRFFTLAETLENLEPISSRTLMIGMLADLLKQADPVEVGELVYLTQGRLLPDFIQQEFGINERLLNRAISQAYGVPLETVVAGSKELGDAGLTAQSFAGAGSQGQMFDGVANLELTEVYKRLMAITGATGQGSQEAKVTLMSDLLRLLSPLEAKHVTRIVVGRLRVGIGDPTLMEALSAARAGDKSLRPAIERAYNLSSDLGLVARTLYGGGVDALDNIKVQVGNPVRMALAERANSATEIIDRLGLCAVEPKFDGFRMQIHKNGDAVSIFSRGLENLSGMFPDVVEAVLRQVKARTVIMEGEALAYEPDTGVYRPFQVTSQRRRVHNIEEMSASLPLRLMAFDVLLVDGLDLTRAPYTERRDALAAALAPASGLGGIRPSESIMSEDPDEIEMFYEECLTSGLEGIVAKRLSGTYEAGKRGFNWIKMKRSYQTLLRDTVDCAIVGYYYGRGRRAKWGIGSLLVSVYDKDSDTLPTITRVASGLSDEGWQDLRRRLNEDRIEHPDPRVRYILKPDLWVVPRYVVELQADEVSRSQMHSAGKTDGQPGYALRFPRIVKERSDREPSDATSVAEVIELYKMQGVGDTRGVKKRAAKSDGDTSEDAPLAEES